MPYIDGKRVSPEEWQAKYGSTQEFHTGPDGANPAEPPELDPETGAPEVKKKSKSSGKAGGKRSPRSTKAAKAAVADALGVKPNSDVLDGIDVSGLDAPANADEAADAAGDES